MCSCLQRRRLEKHGKHKRKRKTRICAYQQREAGAQQNTVINHIQGSSKILLEGSGKWKQPATEQEFQRGDVEESQSGACLRAKGSRERNRGRMRNRGGLPLRKKASLERCCPSLLSVMTQMFCIYLHCPIWKLLATLGY